MPARLPEAELNLQRQRRLEAELVRFTARPLGVQRQIAQPVLRAAELHAQEVGRVEAPRAALHRQVATLTAHLPGNAVEEALQRQAERAAPVFAPSRPQSPGDWVTVMRAQAQSVQAQQDAGRGLDPRQSAQFTGLQRQVAQHLVQGYRQDRGASGSRSAQYAEHLLSLQRHPLSAPVARGVLGMLPPVERLSLQRAVDTALQREQAQQDQDAAALRLHTLQRQLAELDAETTQPVFQRIQARRGAGSPLPAAIQRHLEQGLNHDLSRVRIHDDAEADVLAKGVNATAFTTGSDIFFRAGTFNPNSQSGLELLAHEVTHTVQQAQGRVGTGVDPDAGLEAEARSMGARLAQSRPTAQFGTRTKRPGASTVVRTPLQRAVQTDTPAIQRWPNPLAALKKVKDRAVRAVSSTAKRVQQAAQRVVKATVARAKAIAAPAVKLAQKASAKVKATAQKIGPSLRAKMQAAKAKFGQVGGQVRAAVHGTIGQAKAAARQATQALKRQAGQLAQRVAGAVQRVQQTAARGVQIATNRVKRAAGSALGGIKRTAGGLGSGARSLASSVKKAAQPLLDQVSQTARKVREQVGQAASKVHSGLKGAYTQTKAFLSVPPGERIRAAGQGLKAAGQKLGRGLGALGQRAGQGLRTAAGAVGAKARQGRGMVAKAGGALKGKLGAFAKSRPATALALGAGALFTVYQGIRKGGVKGLWDAGKEKVKTAWKWARSPEGRAALVRMGVTVGVGVGAAALTGLTGGLAAPLLIMAIGGAAGGAAGRLAQNAVLKKYGDKKKYKGLKLTEGINWKSALADGALGAAMGPAGALMGGVTRGVAGNLGRFALRPMGRSLAQGLKGLRGARVAQVTARSGRVYTGGVQQPALRQRLSATWQEMKAYNRQLSREVGADIRQSIQGNAGVAGRARTQTKELFGGKRKLKAEQFKIANDRVGQMNRLQLVAHAHHLKLPTNLPVDKLKALVAQGLVKTNDRLVARPIEQQALKLARKQALRDAVQHLTGAPRKKGEGAALHALRRVGSTFGMGVRANYRNLLDKDQAWAEAIQKGQGFAYLGGTMTNESTKAAAVAYRTEVTKPEGQQKPVDMGKAVRDGTMNTFGVNPDLFTEKALAAALGAQQVATNVSSTYGAGAVSDNVQLDDPPEPEERP